MIPEPVKKLISAFASLPSIGPRQATRLAFHLLGSSQEKIDFFQNAFNEIEKVKKCKQCFFYFLPSNKSQSQKNFCSICTDKDREQHQICILEKETDLLSLEKSRKYGGVYFILGGHLLLGADRNLKRFQNESVKKSHSRLSLLKKHIEKNLGGKADEIIIATNPTSEGDLTASFLKKELVNHAKKITRLGRGIPTGGDIEFADEETLGESFKNRN